VLPQKVAAARFVNVCTEHAASQLRALCPQHADKIHTIYHGLDPDALPSGERHPTDPPTILAVGRLVPKKGFEHLIEACRRVIRSGVAFRCVIAGGGPLRHRLGTLAQKGGLTQLTITGALSPQEVESLYASASVFVCPSVVARDGDRDGLPNVLLEAMAWRLPVVGSDVGGIPEAVAHEVTGLIVPPSDPGALAKAIKRLLADGSLASTLGDNGRRLVIERFNIRSNIEPLLRLF
jgi:glycosyltransferase involved in cell wall biosynthesis